METSKLDLFEASKNMSEKGGGFHFGNIGGNVSQSAGGDMVGGDKTTTTTTTIQKGFADEEKKEQFHSEIEQFREGLRAMKTEIEASAALDQDKKDEVIAEILQQVKALKEVKEKTAEVPPGGPAPAQVATEIEGTLDRAGGIVDKLQGLAGKAGDVAETVSKFAVKYGPLILSARHLFGLP
jgi:translation initiation factor 2 gamma subunit (eIF-2gamma)